VRGARAAAGVRRGVLRALFRRGRRPRGLRAVRRARAARVALVVRGRAARGVVCWAVVGHVPGLGLQRHAADRPRERAGAARVPAGQPVGRPQDARRLPRHADLQRQHPPRHPRQGETAPPPRAPPARRPRAPPGLRRAHRPGAVRRRSWSSLRPRAASPSSSSAPRPSQRFSPRSTPQRASPPSSPSWSRRAPARASATSMPRRGSPGRTHHSETRTHSPLKRARLVCERRQVCLYVVKEVGSMRINGWRSAPSPDPRAAPRLETRRAGPLTRLAPRGSYWREAWHYFDWINYVVRRPPPPRPAPRAPAPVCAARAPGRAPPARPQHRPSPARRHALCV
jgi:hypothetical protein